MRFSVIFGLLACRTPETEHQETIETLQEAIYNQDTATEQIDPLQRSTHYLVFNGESSCLIFEETEDRSDIPLSTPYWSFSFLLADPVSGLTESEDTSQTLFTFTRGNSYLKLQIDTERLNIAWCNGLDECNTDFIPAPEFVIGDRMTFSYGNETLSIYQNETHIANIAKSNQFSANGILRFGCTQSSMSESFRGWKGGVDTLVLLTHSITPIQIQNLVSTDTPHLFLRESTDLFSYWNMGEEGSQEIIDSHGDCDGRGTYLAVREHED